jgi:hypothetical protein
MNGVNCCINNNIFFKLSILSDIIYIVIS